MSTRLVFVDESERRARYLMCSVTIAPAEIGTLRRTMRKLLLPGQSQLHFKNESARRRRALGGSLVALGLDVAIVSTSSEPGLRRADLRDRWLAEVIADAQDRGDPAQMYLESRHHQDEADHASFSRWRQPEPSLNYEHVESSTDPLLWLPDAFAWLAGAGGEWAEIVRPALRRLREAGSKAANPARAMTNPVARTRFGGTRRGRRLPAPRGDVPWRCVGDVRGRLPPWSVGQLAGQSRSVGRARHAAYPS